MNQLFRMELNISSLEPLPRIAEAGKEEDEVLSHSDFRDKYAPKDEEERAILDVTRNKLSTWFPL